MSSNLTGVNGEKIIRDSISNSGGNVTIIHASPPVLSEYIKEAHEKDKDIDKIRVLGTDETLKDVMEDFLVASAASDLIKQGKLEVLSAEDGGDKSIVILGDNQVMSFVNLDGTIGALSSDDSSLVEKTKTVFNEMWGEGDEFKIRTPPITDVQQSLKEEIGEETEKDFTAILGILDTARGDGDGLDEITIALLSAARNKVLLYDISKWGEDSGVASKATFSRKKTELETQDIIDTENVPIDIGRPRLRLRFKDDELQDAPLEEIVEYAKNKLGSN